MVSWPVYCRWPECWRYATRDADGWPCCAEHHADLTTILAPMWTDQPIVQADGDSHILRSVVLDAAATLCDRLVALPYAVVESDAAEPSCGDCRRLSAAPTSPQPRVINEGLGLLPRQGLVE